MHCCLLLYASNSLGGSNSLLIVHGGFLSDQACQQCQYNIQTGHNENFNLSCTTTVYNVMLESLYIKIKVTV